MLGYLVVAGRQHMKAESSGADGAEAHKAMSPSGAKDTEVCPSFVHACSQAHSVLVDVRRF